MKFGYPKEEKLKSKKQIDALFTQGKNIYLFPLKLVFIETQLAENETIKFGVSVSKRYFKKAVDRNYYKRILRETYRLNKHILTENHSNYAFMLLYVTSEKHSFKDVNDKVVKIFQKFSQTYKN